MSELNDRSILVTGGAGFIGSALVWALNRGLSNIVVSDKLGTDEKWRNLVSLKFADYIDGDDLIGRLEADPDAIGPVGVVFHLGACSATTERDSDYLMRNNFEYTKRLCRWALDRDARFVYASSAATYGDGGHGMGDGDADLDPLRPLNMWVRLLKHLFDCYAKRHGFLDRIVGLKYFNVFGPNEDHKADMRSMVHKAYGQIVESGRVRLFKSHRPGFGDGEQRRDFLYVKDAVRMTLFLADCAEEGGLYNIGSGTAHTWIDLVTPIFEALGREVDIEFVDMPEALRGKYQYHTCADVTRLGNAGYPPGETTPLAESVRDYVLNYLVGDKRLGDDDDDDV